MFQWSRALKMIDLGEKSGVRYDCATQCNKLTVGARRVVSLTASVDGEVERPAEELSDEQVEADDDRRVLEGLSEFVLSNLGHAAISHDPENSATIPYLIPSSSPSSFMGPTPISLRVLGTNTSSRVK